MSASRKGAKTRLSKTGQPVMGTTVRVLVIDDEQPDKGEFWVEGVVVGKLFGPGGSADMTALVVEVTDEQGRSGRVTAGRGGWGVVR